MKKLLSRAAWLGGALARGEVRYMRDVARRLGHRELPLGRNVTINIRDDPGAARFVQLSTP